MGKTRVEEREIQLEFKRVNLRSSSCCELSIISLKINLSISKSIISLLTTHYSLLFTPVRYCSGKPVGSQKKS
tara:strand:+ start:103667 stop:103885 length:219 start_codon:yes stop_codon:yes gene_type:complete